MAVKARGGLATSFDKNKLVSREFAVVTDTGEVYVCFSAGNVKQIATKEDIATVLNTSPTAYSALVQCVTDLQNNPSQLTNILNNISALQSGKIDKTSIVNNLTTDDSSKVLSANQGKVLNDNLALQTGTFTPILKGVTTAGTNTYATQGGYYVRIYKRVFFEIYIAMSAKDVAMAGAVRISGLPFAAIAAASYRASGAVGFNGSITYDSARPNLTYLITPSATEIQLKQSGSNAASTDIDSAQIANATIIMLSGSYQIS